MHRSTALFFLSTCAVTGALVVGSSVEGCRGNTQSGFGGYGTGGSPTSSSSVTGTGGFSNVPVVTIDQITDPDAGGYVTGSEVQLKGVVATSIKFLVSKSSSGSCLWGAFFSAPGLTTVGPHTAILAVNDGTMASATDGGKAYCPTTQAGQPAGDLFPDDTAPGDVFDIVGVATSYVPSACGAPDAAPPNNSNVAQYQLATLSLVTRTSRGAPVPAPYVLSSAEAATLAAGVDQGFFGQWGGARVTVQDVTAVLQQGATFDTYGHMLLNDGIQVGDKMYYVGYVAATDRCYAGPYFMSTTPTFQSLTGFAYLDYCTWGIDPADKCADFVPPSGDCASVLDAGPDANPAQVCTHAPEGTPVGTP